MIDWHSVDLDLETVITEDFRVSPKVRRFFVAHIGPDFTMSREFRAWVKANIGCTLGEAIAHYRAG